MPTKLLIAATVAILVASPALAATQAASKSHAIAISTNTKTHHHHRMATKVSMRGAAEVRALNALEAAGYRQFDNLHAHGKDFVATASKAGKSYDVTVMPSGSIKASIA